MRKNNKGFTLIELLAVVVILGILMVLFIPMIVNLLGDSRNKIYVSDAQKLISKAEYKIKSASSDIEKPDPGDCIVISLLYLDGEEFDNPPNGGKYEREKSFVIVKNTGTKLEYSATLVEKTKKNGYIGVDLTSYSNLLNKNSISKVRSFKASELIYVETDVTRTYINNKLGNNYLSSSNTVSAIYNYPDLADSSVQTNSSNPKITKAVLTSTSLRDFNTLDATLTLKIEDKDTPRSSLKIYMSTTGYSTSNSNALGYSGEEVYSTNIDFAAMGYGYDGTTVKVYIVVQDPEGNTAKKTLSYKIHKNTEPQIQSSTSVGKRPYDRVNMQTGLVNLSVEDDVDSLGDLKVCLNNSTSSTKPTSCSDYRNYYEYFNEENKMEFDFCNGTNCARDGSKHYLTIFVKDTLGGVSSVQLDYTFSSNSRPTITSSSVTPKVESFAQTGSKNIFVRVTATDDVDDQAQLTVKVNDGSHTETYPYNTDETAVYDFTINGNYDGSTKTITISVTDREGATSSVTKSYTLYSNSGPTISNTTTIESDGYACPNEDLCPITDGGNKKVKIKLSATDDMDPENLSVCVSNTTTCTNYISYNENFRDKEYYYNVSNSYDGGTKKIYIKVKDSQGIIATKDFDYKLYKNKAPIIDTFSIVSKTEPFTATGSLNAYLHVIMRDDFDDKDALKITVKEGETVKINNANYENYEGEKDYTISGTYDGRVINFKLIATDSQGAQSEKNYTYNVYQNSAPDIKIFTVSSKEEACLDPDLCPIDGPGDYNVKYAVKVEDDIDSASNISVCVSTSSSSCTSYSSYTGFYDFDVELPIEHDYTFTMNDPTRPYDGSTKDLYLYAKDSTGAISKKKYTYTIYNNKAPREYASPVIVSNSYNPDLHIPDVTYSVYAYDDLDNDLQIKYCKKLNGTETCTSYEEYHEDKVLDNSFFGVSRPNGEEYKIYAYVKDTYGAEAKLSETTYKLFNDVSPVLDAIDYTIKDDRLRFYFRVDDAGDLFSVHMTFTNQNSGSSSFDFNSCYGCQYEFRGDKELYYVDLSMSELPFYNSTGSMQVTLTDTFNNSIVAGTFTINQVNSNVCQSIDNYEASYEYTFNTGNPSDNEPITIDRCNGICFRANSSIFGYYTKKKIPYDKFSYNTCPSHATTSTYKAYCDFKDCFYKNNNYQRYAIGVRYYDDETPWTTTVNGTSYVCNGHYNLYLSNYNSTDDVVTLTKTNTKICAEAIDNDYYKYNSSSNNPYVLVSD